MFKKIAFVFVGLIVILVIIIALQPGSFTVTRSAVMAAPPERVFAQVNDFKNWNAWSPWAKLDPNCKYTFGGPASGEGATWAWAGNDEVGEGKLTITESKPGERVVIHQEFIRPMTGVSRALFTFAPEGAGSAKVTWTMSGDKNFLSKAFCMFMDMDAIVGGDFEKGLASMKAIAEGTVAAAAIAPAASAE